MTVVRNRKALKILDESTDVPMRVGKPPRAEKPIMKGALALCLLVLAVIPACSVDMSKLRPPHGASPDAASDGVLADATGTASEATDSALLPDGPAVTGDGAPSSTDGPMTGSDGASDISGHETGATLDSGLPTSDLAPTSSDLPETSLDSPRTPDLPADFLADAEPDLPLPADSSSDQLADSATYDDASSDADASTLAGDASEAGGLANGVACTSAAQCRSGFCVGAAGRCCAQECASACYRPNQCSAAGACTPVPGTVTCGELDAVCGLTVNDPASAMYWSFQKNLRVGSLATGTDQHTISAVPAELAGAPWIRPARGSKTVTTNPLVTFTLSAPADVYVGIDSRVSAPSWMSAWSDSGMSIAYSVYSPYEPTTTVTQRLFVARFPAGDVPLGPMACTDTSTCSMYLTILRFADQAIGTASTCK